MAVTDAGGIKVFCDIPYLKIMELESLERVNEHANISIKLQVSEESISWLEMHSLCNRGLRIDMITEENTLIRLCGNIISARWESCNDKYYVSICALSTTKRMDEKENTCIYQRIGFPYKTFIKKIVENHRGNILMIDGSSEVVRQPIIQYRETDWELIRRLAAQLNTVVIVNAGSDRPEFSVGCIKGKVHPVPSFLKLKESYLEKGFVIHTWDNYMLGEQVIIANKTLTVLEKNMKLSKGGIEYTYHVGNPERSIFKAEEKLRGVSVCGKIVEVMDEYVKLDFGRIEDISEMSQNYKYRYLPITGNIMYAMPEKGTKVELYFPTSNIKQAYVRNCFLPSSEWLDESTKCLVTCYGKAMIMEPAGIVWRAQSEKGSQEIRLQQTAGIQLSSSREIMLTAKGDITLQARMTCMISSGTEMEMEQTGTINSLKVFGSSIKMSSERYETAASDIGGKVQQQNSDSMPECDLSEIKQYVFAAIPYQQCDPLTEQVLASTPMILSISSSKDTGAGYSR